MCGDFDMLHLNQRKEQFSIAFIQAIATVAGYVLYQSKVDFDSIDFGIETLGDAQTPRRPKVELQLKCMAHLPKGATIPFELPVKNYNDLRVAKLFVPRILVLVIVPHEIERWLELSEELLALRNCAYWYSLHGAGETQNEHSVTIHVPRTQVFTPEVLRAMMQRINDGGLP